MVNSRAYLKNVFESHCEYLALQNRFNCVCAVRLEMAPSVQFYELAQKMAVYLR